MAIDKAVKKANILIEALPYIKKFQRKIFVIKYGGSILSEAKVRKSVLTDIVFLRYAGIRPILIHGGGPNINDKLKELKIPVKFSDGLRVTDKVTLKVVEEELNQLNTMIAKEFSAHGVGVSCFRKEDGLLRVVKKESKSDLGYVGEIVDFDREKLDRALEDTIPVIVPMGVSSRGDFFNINGDDVACFLARRMQAEKIVLLTSVLGVMRDVGRPESLISTITQSEVDGLLAKKVIDAGMVPKIKAAAAAVGDGVGKAHIVDAKINHALLLEIFTDTGIGTEVVK